MKQGDPAQASVKSAVRVLELFEYFDQIACPATMADIVRALDWPQSSTSMLVASLVRRGYLAYAADGRLLHPTARLSLLGRWTDERVADHRIAGLMADLSAMTGETVLLGTPNDTTCVYIEVVPATRPMRLHISRGMTRPIAGSGMGLLLLSALDNAAVTARVERVNRMRAPDEALIDTRAVITEIETIRQSGFAISTDRVVTGAGLVCMLLPPVEGRPALGLGLGGQSAVITAQRDALVTLLHAKITQWMG